MGSVVKINVVFFWECPPGVVLERRALMRGLCGESNTEVYMPMNVAIKSDQEKVLYLR